MVLNPQSNRTLRWEYLITFALTWKLHLSYQMDNFWCVMIIKSSIFSQSVRCTQCFIHWLRCFSWMFSCVRRLSSRPEDSRRKLSSKSEVFLYFCNSLSNEIWNSGDTLCFWVPIVSFEIRRERASAHNWILAAARKGKESRWKT